MPPAQHSRTSPRCVVEAERSHAPSTFRQRRRTASGARSVSGRDGPGGLPSRCGTAGGPGPRGRCPRPSRRRRGGRCGDGPGRGGPRPSSGRPPSPPDRRATGARDRCGACRWRRARPVRSSPRPVSSSGASTHAVAGMLRSRIGRRAAARRCGSAWDRSDVRQQGGHAPCRDPCISPDRGERTCPFLLSDEPSPRSADDEAVEQEVDDRLGVASAAAARLASSAGASGKRRARAGQGQRPGRTVRHEEVEDRQRAPDGPAARPRGAPSMSAHQLHGLVDVALVDVPDPGAIVARPPG